MLEMLRGRSFSVLRQPCLVDFGSVVLYLGESLPKLGVYYGIDLLGFFPAMAAFAALIGGLGALTVLLAARQEEWGLRYAGMKR